MFVCLCVCIERGAPGQRLNECTVASLVVASVCVVCLFVCLLVCQFVCFVLF